MRRSLCNITNVGITELLKKQSLFRAMREVLHQEEFNDMLTVEINCPEDNQPLDINGAQAKAQAISQTRAQTRAVRPLRMINSPVLKGEFIIL